MESGDPMKESTIMALGILLMVAATLMSIFNYYVGPTPKEWRFIHPLLLLVLYILIPWEVVKAIRRKRRGEVQKRAPLPLRQRLIAAIVLVILFAALILLVLYLGTLIEAL